MKKDQMQAIIDEQVDTIHKLRKEISDLQSLIKNYEDRKSIEIKKVKDDLRDELYNQWVQMNAQFVKRYIGDLISKNVLTFSFDDDWNSYFHMHINMGDTRLATSTGRINTHSYGLEE